MKDHPVLRKELLALLDGGQAHVDVKSALGNIPAEMINREVSGSPYTLWQLLEHLRITQHDILEFMQNPQRKSPEWPREYWPEKDMMATADDWEHSLKHFLNDLAKVCDIVRSPFTDFFSDLPHAPRYTILREILLIADHNAHHLGQVILLRRLLDVWSPA